MKRILILLLLCASFTACKKKPKFNPSDYNIVFTVQETFSGNVYQSPYILSLNSEGAVTAAAANMGYTNTGFKYEWDGEKTLSIKLASNGYVMFLFDIENERIIKATDASGAVATVFDNLSLQRKPKTNVLSETTWKGNLALGGTTYFKFNQDATALKYGNTPADLENNNNTYHPCTLIGNQAVSYKIGNEKWSVAVVINDVLHLFHFEGPGTSIGKLIRQ